MNQNSDNERKSLIAFVSLFLSRKGNKRLEGGKVKNTRSSYTVSFQVGREDSAVVISSITANISYQLRKEGAGYSLVDPAKKDFISFMRHKKEYSVFDYYNSLLYEINGLESNRPVVIDSFRQRNDEFTFTPA